jgi:hypothetical protein
MLSGQSPPLSSPAFGGETDEQLFLAVMQVVRPAGGGVCFGPELTNVYLFVPGRSKTSSPGPWAHTLSSGSEGQDISHLSEEYCYELLCLPRFV